MPFPESARSGSSSCVTWWCREPVPSVAARVPRRALPRARRRKCRALLCARARSRRRVARACRGCSRRRRASLARGRGAPPRRLVVGQRAPRRARPKRATRAGRHSGAFPARRDQPGAPEPVRAARSRASHALRTAPVPRIRPARASARPRAAAGRRDRDNRDRAAATAEGARLRRAHVAQAPGHPRRPPRGPLGPGRSPRRPRRIRRRFARRGLPARSRPVFTASGTASSKGSCSVTSRRSPRTCGSGSEHPGSTTCSPSPARTSRSSRPALSRSSG